MPFLHVTITPAVLPGDLADLSTRTLLRGAEPAVRGIKVKTAFLRLLIGQNMAAQAAEPCQDGNIAALRQSLRVSYL